MNIKKVICKCIEKYGSKFIMKLKTHWTNWCRKKRLGRV